MLNRRSSLVVAAGLLTLCASPPAHAELDHRLSLLAAGDIWLRPERGGHGIFLVAYDLKGLLPRQAALSAGFNTDTFRLGVGGLRLWNGRLELAARAGYEIQLAGLLFEYFRDGVNDPSRGFSASYLELAASAKLRLAAHHSLELTLGARRWFFAPREATNPTLILPAEAWALEPRLRYTWWRLEGDRAWGERHRFFPRLRGVAFSVVLGLDWRSATRPWGARSGGVAGVPDLRNDPGPASFTGQQTLIAGTQLHPRLRTQIRELAFFGAGLDDLNRLRVGGLNPYVLQVAGAPWASYLAERALAARWSWHVRLIDDLEVGALADLAWVDDLRRTGTSKGDVIVGAGIFLDMRWRDFQLDIQGGVAPQLAASRPATQLGVFAALGWQWD